MRFQRAGAVVAVLALVLVAAACGGDDDTKSKKTPADAPTVTILTIDGLTPAVAPITRAYNKRFPDANAVVKTVDLAQMQSAVTSSSPPDVLLVPSAWGKSLAGKATKGSLDSSPYGRFLFVIATPKGNPAGVTDLQAFTDGAGKRTVVCGPVLYVNLAVVPFYRAQLTPAKDTVKTGCEATVVKQLTKGQIDGAVILRTAVAGKPGIAMVPIPDAQNLEIPLVVLTNKASTAAAAFMGFVNSTDGRRILTRTGYAP
jgi:ABC-type phosphate transport system substrate-binding protein